VLEEAAQPRAAHPARRHRRETRPCSVARRARSKDSRDPAGAMRTIADAFASLRVMPSDLEEYLGHPFDKAAPAELEELRAAYVCVRDGEARWVELVDFQRQRAGRGRRRPRKPAAAAGDKLRAKMSRSSAKAARRGDRRAEASPRRRREGRGEDRAPAKSDAPSKPEGRSLRTTLPRSPSSRRYACFLCVACRWRFRSTRQVASSAKRAEQLRRRSP
jgi:hypothetical protein